MARAETTTATTRVFAFTTGTLGLLAVGLLMVAVTPSSGDAPIAVSATTTLVSGEGGGPVAMATTALGPAERWPLGLRAQPQALATPIGEGRYAVVTAADLVATGGATLLGTAVEVAVPSGRMLDALVVGRTGDAVLVELERSEPGLEVADEQPDRDEIVTLLAEPPVTVVLGDLASLDVAEGTAVLDDDGELVGLCSQGRSDETILLVVSDELLEGDPGPAGSPAETGAGDDAVSEAPVGATTGE